jgi:hypothetical protein
MNPWMLTIVIVLIFILLIIFIPIKYKLSFDYHQQLNFRAAIRYGILFNVNMNKRNGMSEYKLRILGIPLHLQNTKTSKSKKNNKIKPDDSLSWDVIRSFFHNKAYRPLRKLVGRIFNNLKPNYLIIKGEYGFFEPHNTAFLNMLLSIVPQRPPHYIIQLEPVWDDEKLEVDGLIKGAVTIAEIIYNLILFILNRSTFRLIKDILKDKKRKRKQTQIIMQPLS